ncbi:hypothetical protein D8666_13230 [Ochrobactrum soli]|uniref:ATP-binding protein n=1 Tax=Ochrobactrum soli TaxID=2448455 RepID=UPI000EF21046|nr:ATP-binding protein [[Ochrobactrum] soli]RLL74243.1 hypothetical protein D8666_13230 [[Ochrobactrum] soli]
MSEVHYHVTVEKDHLRKLSAAKPIPALAELIWNGLDADATRVDINFEETDISRSAILITDNGHGIRHNEVEGIFTKLGGSWKANGRRSRDKDRILHGKEGKGRFKALAFGRAADWISVFRAEDGKKYQFTISILRDNITDVRVSNPIAVDDLVPTGVQVRITELDQGFRSLNPEHSVQPLSEIFALYLTDYKDASIYVEHQILDPDSLIARRTPLQLTPIRDGDIEYEAQIELIEWHSTSERWIFLCGDEGFPFHRISPTFHTPGHQFSAYLKSNFINRMQEQGLMDFADMNAQLHSALDEATDKIKQHFKDIDTEVARSEIDKWKEENVYPYSEEPKTTVEIAERKIFEIVALNVNQQLADFNDLNPRSKAFQLRMLRHAIERGPEELQHILREVLQLPQRKQQELSKLLEEASLSNIITASRLVSDRMKFLTGLDALIFEPDTKRLLKERSQLHRMIADNNTWIFGEHFNLTVDDQSLTAVLRKHKQAIGEDVVIDAPVKRIDGKVGIVDLMLSRSVPLNHPDEMEHLVVELKRPSQPVGAREITQVEQYAFTIAKDERFRHLKTRWSFWVVSNDLDDYAKEKTRQKNMPRGMVHQNEEGTIEVWAKSWSEIIAENVGRMQFVQEHLQANVDRDHALSYLRKTYEKYLSNLPINNEDDEKENAEAAQ